MDFNHSFLEPSKNILFQDDASVNSFSFEDSFNFDSPFQKNLVVSSEVFSQQGRALEAPLIDEPKHPQSVDSFSGEEHFLDRPDTKQNAVQSCIGNFDCQNVIESANSLSSNSSGIMNNAMGSLSSDMMINAMVSLSGASTDIVNNVMVASDSMDIKCALDTSSDQDKELDKALGTPAAQRITKEDLEKYYNYPLIDVAKAFNVSTTILKRICRKYGILRWPHRQIRSIDKTIEQLREQALLLDPPQSTELLQQVDLLQRKKKLIIRTSSCGLSATLRNAIFMARPGEVDEDVLFGKGLLPHLQAAMSSNENKDSTISVTPTHRAVTPPQIPNTLPPSQAIPEKPNVAVQPFGLDFTDQDFQAASFLFETESSHNNFKAPVTNISNEHNTVLKREASVHGELRMDQHATHPQAASVPSHANLNAANYGVNNCRPLMENHPLLLGSSPLTSYQPPLAPLKPVVPTSVPFTYPPKDQPQMSTQVVTNNSIDQKQFPSSQFIHVIGPGNVIYALPLFPDPSKQGTIQIPTALNSVAQAPPRPQDSPFASFGLQSVHTPSVQQPINVAPGHQFSMLPHFPPIPYQLYSQPLQQTTNYNPPSVGISNEMLSSFSPEQLQIIHALSANALDPSSYQQSG